MDALTPALTPAEKAAGLAFLDACEAAFAALPAADRQFSAFLHHIRHVCPKLGKSVSFEAKEIYTESPPYLITTADFGTEELTATEVTPERYGEMVEEQKMTAEAFDGREELRKKLSIVRGLVPVGKFAWIYREGHCPDCGLTGRSGDGRLTDARRRPPLGRS